MFPMQQDEFLELFHANAGMLLNASLPGEVTSGAWHYVTGSFVFFSISLCSTLCADNLILLIFTVKDKDLSSPLIAI